MNGYLEVGILEVDQENEVPFSDRLQHQKDCLNFEFGKGDISVQIWQVEHGMPPRQRLLHQTQPDVVIWSWVVYQFQGTLLEHYVCFFLKYWTLADPEA